MEKKRLTGQRCSFVSERGEDEVGEVNQVESAERRHIVSVKERKVGETHARLLIVANAHLEVSLTTSARRRETKLKPKQKK